MFIFTLINITIMDDHNNSITNIESYCDGYRTKSISEWTKEDVAWWVRKVLNRSEKSANILLEGNYTGQDLLSFTSLENMRDHLAPAGVPIAVLHRIWDAVRALRTLVAWDNYGIDRKTLQEYVFQAHIRTEDNNEFTLNAQAVASFNRTIILTAKHTNSEEKFNIKCCRGGSEAQFLNELKILKKLNEANVPNVPRISFIGELHYIDQTFLAIGTDTICESFTKLPWNEVKLMIEDVLETLKALRKLNIVHSDIKPANIVRFWDPSMQRNRYMLVGFGHSFAETDVTVEYGYSIPYASIQVLDGADPTWRDDHRSLWYTMVELALGHLTKWAKQGLHRDWAEASEIEIFFNDLYEATHHQNPFLWWDWFLINVDMKPTN